MDQLKVFLTQQLLIGEALKCAALYVPDRPAFEYEDKQLTYQGLLERASHLSGWLREQGIGRNDKVGCLFKNGIPFVELYFGVSLNGAVFVPVNFRLVSAEIEYILNNSDVKVLFIEEEFIETIRPIIDKLSKVLTLVIVGSVDRNLHVEVHSYESIFEYPSVYEPNEMLNDEDPHVIIYTSGTTGKPKGAVLTHKNLYMNGMNKLFHNPLPKATRHLVIPPLFHIAALSLLVQNCLTQGMIVLHREFQPVQILETIQNKKINSMFLVPSMWNLLFQVPNFFNYDLSSMKTCAIGGAICPVELKKQIMNVFKNAIIYEAFGQTEMSPSTTYLYGEDSILHNKTASVGKPCINVRVRIVNDEMEDVPLGEVGEIVYQGPTMMKEYYKNSTATVEAFKGGWFHSGDLVRMDEDGYIYVMDRKKDMIISGGENIYPKELEEVLYTHPDISEVAVVGIPDPKWGETIKAFIVLKPGKQLTKEDIIEFCKNKLASYKKPRVIEFIESLPRNAAGKVLKTVLRSSEQENKTH